jgi:hypothetical protein
MIIMIGYGTNGLSLMPFTNPPEVRVCNLIRQAGDSSIVSTLLD